MNEVKRCMHDPFLDIIGQHLIYFLSVETIRLTVISTPLYDLLQLKKWTHVANFQSKRHYHVYFV